VKPAVVLLSGGMDSATVLAMAKQEYEPYALSFGYGQRHVAAWPGNQLGLGRFTLGRELHA
jgi:7-cyano-7-deazaguanine synthase in queuosine biosynthesis